MHRPSRRCRGRRRRRASVATSSGAGSAQSRQAARAAPGASTSSSGGPARSARTASARPGGARGRRRSRRPRRAAEAERRIRPRSSAPAIMPPPAPSRRAGRRRGCRGRCSGRGRRGSGCSSERNRSRVVTGSALPGSAGPVTCTRSGLPAARPSACAGSRAALGSFTKTPPWPFIGRSATARKMAPAPAVVGRVDQKVFQPPVHDQRRRSMPGERGRAPRPGPSCRPSRAPDSRRRPAAPRFPPPAGRRRR